MMNPVITRIEKLRSLMAEKKIDIYVIPTSDFHESEYVGEYFKARQFMTGFSGSAGTAVVTASEAFLWTDGRYFIQAEGQLEGSGVSLFRMGEEGVPTVKEYLEEKLPECGCIGFDGRVVNAKTGESYGEIAAKKHGNLMVEEDLVDMVWTDRCEMSKEPFFLLEEKYTGCSCKEKLAAVREKMKEEGTDIHILSSLYDIAWLLNVRGNDIAYVPVVLSYIALTDSECIWFLQEDIITEEQRAYLRENQITTQPYQAIVDYAKTVHEGKKVWLDRASVNYRIVHQLSPKVELIDKSNPTELMKAIKNPTEVTNTIAAHVKDGVAFTKFMYWVKHTVTEKKLTEISASDYLEARRREQEHFLELSFDTICAYGANAAMMHYAATPESDATLKPEGFLLVDSGGHYLEGTTDITRTIALGSISEEMRRNFTAVCRGNLNLASAKFLHGCRGLNLDILCRAPLWNMGIDYRCGTGHGVGYVLNVHEGPNGFRWKLRDDVDDNAVFEEGMITTDEPGVYIEGSYGIRTENELVCKKAEKNEYGQFMCFQNITYAPIDLDAIDPEEMTKTERKLLNDYHRMVFQTLSPYMTEEENIWLKEYTREI